MKQASYDALRKFVYDKAGIALGDGKQALVQARIGQRLRALGLSDPDEYIRVVLSDTDDSEIVNLLDVISTNFTSFFREDAHFQRLDNVLRDWKIQGQRSFRVWCAAASTGEEPYTLSMVCQEALGDKADLKILATDISTRVLRACNEGVYTKEKLENVPENLRRKWFKACPEKEFLEVTPALRSPLTFARLNLAVVPYAMKGPFDVIFCRNVMIYFDNDGRRRFATQATRLLKPGGFLFIGHSESLSGLIEGFKVVAPSVYQRNS